VRRPSAKALAKACAEFNKDNQAGDAVRYWPGLREGPGKVGRLKTSARVLGGHTAGVYIEGEGFHALSHVEASS
jgi:hypothetical protein